MTRPKLRRGAGFTRSKRGRDKLGGSSSGRGTRGRGASHSVGEISDSESYSSDGASDAASDGDFSAAVIGDGNGPAVETPGSTEQATSESMDLEEEATTLPSIEEALSLLRAVLPKGWLPFADQNGIHICMLSCGSDKAIQRTVFISFNGDVRVSVHRRTVSSELLEDIVKQSPPVPLSRTSLKQFVDRALSLVLYVRTFEICAGQDSTEYEHLWSSDDGGSVDSNPYDENRYTKTFRSSNCKLLVPVQKWRCKECLKVGHRFRQRHLMVGEEYNINTPNIHLSEEQKNKKLKDQQQKIRTLKKRISVLEKRVAKALAVEGVNVSAGFSEQLSETLKGTKLTPLQELFIQQQCKSASVKGKSGMRWHPTLIRFALLIKSESSAAYRAIRDSGMITLPGESTLFDYSHVLPQKTGVNHAKIKLIAEKVSNLKEDYQKFHNLMFDEIHICSKLVYSKTTGEMIGYVNLDEVSEEMRFLTQKMNSGKGDDEAPIATKMLAYMVKGVANGIKEVVASYLTSNLTKEDLYDFSWEVIAALEVAGIKVLTVICDGAGVNRGFFDMHKPAIPTKSGVVYNTVNLCAPERLIFFVSDVPHLLKTLRNAFAKSGRGPKCKKLLTKGGQQILWSTIERLYLEDHENVWRQSHKLNAINVYLNSYTCMKVSYAAQVMSKTVSLDGEGRNWPNTSETWKFIRNVNDFFDCLNGAHSEQGKRKQNPLLNPYTSCDDERFEMLEGFLKYLHDWQSEVKALPNLKKKERDRLFLPHQTVEGIEISIRGIIGAIKFMINQNPGKVFINARVFCQDPLEQYFGKQRSRLGGSTNPNAAQFLQTDNMISVHRDLNVRRRSGNTEAASKHMEITEEPLAKRKRKK